MSDFTIDVAQVDRAATAYEDTRQKAKQAHSDSQSLRVPDGAFGRVPWLSDKLREPYTEQVTACSDAINDTVETIEGLIEALKQVAAAYRETETHNADDANRIIMEMDLS
jgi:hypothetical protein